MAGWNIDIIMKDVGLKYCLVSISGALDAYSFPKMEETLNNLFEGGNLLYIVDCKNLVYISSAGLGTLMGFAKKLRENNGDLKIIHLSNKIHNIMDVLGFTTVFEIFKTEDDAAAAFKKGK